MSQYQIVNECDKPLITVVVYRQGHIRRYYCFDDFSLYGNSERVLFTESQAKIFCRTYKQQADWSPLYKNKHGHVKKMQLKLKRVNAG